MPAKSSLLRALAVGAILVLLISTATRAQVNIVPVSRHLHANAFGQTNDTPPDIDLTTETGTFSILANTAGGQASVTSVFNPFATNPNSHISLRLSAHGSVNPGGSGVASTTFQFDVTQPSTLHEVLTPMATNFGQ